MTLAPGTRIGPYEIVGQIGAGGMGEVYRARDREMSWCCADALAAIGETDQALHWLANAIDLGFVNHQFFSIRDTFLAPLRGDPRFEALMEQARSKQQALGEWS